MNNFIEVHSTLWSIIIIIIIIIKEKISVIFSPKTARTRNTQKDMFGRQRNKQEGQQHVF